MAIAFSIAVIWVVVGATVAAKTWSREQGGLIWAILLWPLQLAARYC